MTAAIKLYDCTDALEIVHQWLEESGGELTPAIEELLAEAEGTFDQKAERVALKIREMQATADACATEARRLQARDKALNRSADSLKAYLLHQMQTAGRQEIKRPLATLRVQQSPPSILHTPTATEELARDPAWQRFVVTVPAQYRIDSKALIDAWRAKQAVPADAVIAQGQHLRIS